MKRSALVALILLVGCNGSPAPPPPKAKSAAEGPQRERPKPAVEPAPGDKTAAYAKEFPWGDYTGTSRLSGRLEWPEAPDDTVRRALVLKGVKGTPSFGLYYRLRTDEQGEFAFDKIKGGDFKLSDDVSGPAFHWRLRVQIGEGESRSIDLTPANSIAVDDKFPDDGGK